MHIVKSILSLYTYSVRGTMKKTMAFIIIIVLISLPAILLFAGGPGTSAANFLKLGIGARAVGMGESFTAVADDVSSVYWNPAGLAHLKTNALHLSHNIWFQDIHYEFAGVGIPLGMSKGVLGISANYLYLDGIERRTGNTADHEGTFGANDLLITLSYAKGLASIGAGTVLGGINCKSIRQQIDDKKADAFAADLGLQLAVGQITTGLVVQNLGTRIRFIEESYPLPMNYKFGIAYQPYGTGLSVAVDINKPIDNKINFHLGTEYWVGGIIALRAGYLHGDSIQRKALTGKSFSSDSSNELIAFTGLMAGAGFKILGYGLDYAFVPYGELGNTHRVSLGMQF
ncbi:MAG: PorV/PorQ family protein [Elusimicrobia bacterium]|nr:PorV/PorQ family protein [Elusimicrobiota bacterium]MBD3412115.1 PorV/PorQ family protein [Elusimicrobiota bacterium]